MKLLLVGMHFSPPATTLVQAVRLPVRVSLRPEPDNPYDSLAIQCWLKTEDLNFETLADLQEDLLNRGFTIEAIRAEPEWCLGHVGASKGKVLAKARRTLTALVGTEELHDFADFVATGPINGLLRNEFELWTIEVGTT